MPKRLPRIDPKDSLLIEADLEKQVFAFLREKQWRIVRHRPTGTRGHHRYLGEKNAADALIIRPTSVGYLQGFFLELKRPGQRPTLGQLKWMADREREGYRTTWVDNLKQFRIWYWRQLY